MKRKKRQLTKRQKRYIRKAAGIAKNTTQTEIARRLNIPYGRVHKLFNKEQLRTAEKNKGITIASLKKRKFPAHEKIPEIIKLLKETKKKHNMSITAIAKKCGVNWSFVEKISEENNILTKKDRLAIGKQKNYKETELKYKRARELIKTTKLTFVEIAKIMGKEAAFVASANKGKGNDKRVRTKEETNLISWRVIKTNHFTANEKLKIIEGYKRLVIGTLKKKEVPQRDWQRIIDFVSDGLFRTLDYFDPEKGELEHYLAKSTKGHILNAIKRKPIEKSLGTKADPRDQIVVSSKDRAKSFDNLLVKETLEVARKILTKRELHILIEKKSGKTFKQIASKISPRISNERARQIEKAARIKIQNKLGIKPRKK